MSFTWLVQSCNLLCVLLCGGRCLLAQEQVGGDSLLQGNANSSLSCRSPGFPNQKYEPQFQTVYRYQLENTDGGVIRGIFVDFDLAQGQKIEVVDSGRTIVSYEQKVNAVKERPNFVSNSSKVLLRFTNPAWTIPGSHVGWRLKCDYFDSDTKTVILPQSDRCGSIKPNGGIIRFGQWPLIFKHGTMFDCVWLIKPGNGTAAFVKVFLSQLTSRALKGAWNTINRLNCNIESDSLPLKQNSTRSPVNYRSLTLQIRHSNSSMFCCTHTNTAGNYKWSTGIYIHFYGVYKNYKTIFKFSYTSIYEYRYRSASCPVDSSRVLDFCCQDGNKWWRIPWDLRCDGVSHCPNGDDEDRKVCRGTYGGSDNGYVCRSSYSYKFRTFKGCISLDRGRRWCITGYSSSWYRANWGYCFTSRRDAQLYRSLSSSYQPPGRICASSRKMSSSSQLTRCPDGTCVLDYPKSCNRDCSSLRSLWACDDGYCIKDSDKCDTTMNCIDHSDESSRHCPLTCPGSQFSCLDRRQCISSWQKCDGRSDCFDGSDEDSVLCDSPTSGSEYETTLIGVVVAAVCSGVLFCFVCLCKKNSNTESNDQSQNPETHNLTEMTSPRTDTTSSPWPHQPRDPSSGQEANGGTGGADTDALYQSPPEYSTANLYSVPSPEPSAPPVDIISPAAPVPDSITVDASPVPGYDPDVPEPSAPPPAYNDVISDTAVYNLYVPGRDPASESPLLSSRR